MSPVGKHDLQLRKELRIFNLEKLFLPKKRSYPKNLKKLLVYIDEYRKVYPNWFYDNL